jgi:hypothetical protein
MLQFSGKSADATETTSLAPRASAEGTAAVEEQSMHPKGSLPGWARQAGLLAGVFLAGGLTSFVYSYVPLHNAKNWKIAWLEERLAAKDEVVSELEQRLAALESEASGRPDETALEALRDQLASTRRTAGELEKKLAQAERRSRELEQARDSWKSRLAEAEARQQKQLAASQPTASAHATPPAAPGFGEALGDGFERTNRPRVSTAEAEVVVAEGDRWNSADGKAGFELLELGDGVARIVPDPRSTPLGEAPEVIEVAEGGSFRIGMASGHSRRVVVRALDGASGSITVQIGE